MNPVHKRLLFVDNIRVLLIFLVIAFHAGAPYAKVPWYGIQEETTLFSEVVSAWFLTGAVAFFLGLFFMISGYFTPGSYDRKGVKSFLKDRFVRLGIPFIVFFLVVMPFFMYLLYCMSHYHVSYWEFLASVYHWDLHHLWFLEMLSVFTLLYVMWRLLSLPCERMNLGIPGNFHIFIFTCVLAVTTFVIRIWFPVGQGVLLKPAYLPQFLGLFSIGVISYRKNWIFKVPASVGVVWLQIGVVTVLLFPLLYVISGGQYSSLVGGFHWRPFVFAVWEAFVCIGLCVGLLVYFRERVCVQGKLGRAIAANVYGMYLVHLPVVVFLQHALVDVRMYPLIKFFLVTLAGILLSFLVSHYMRKLPCAKKIL